MLWSLLAIVEILRYHFDEGYTAKGKPFCIHAVIGLSNMQHCLNWTGYTNLSTGRLCHSGH